MEISPRTKTSKMKIAVLLAGMPRHYDRCASSILNYFDIDGVEVDFFIHSWVNTWNKPDTAIKEPDEYEKNFIKNELQKIYNPKKILIENQLKHTELKKDFEALKSTQLLLQNFHKNSRSIAHLGVEGIDESLGVSKGYKFFLNCLHVGQLYSIEQVSNLRSVYEKENNFKYDFVFRFRLDSFIKHQDQKVKQQTLNNVKVLAERREKLAINGIEKCAPQTFHTRWSRIYGPINHICDDFFGCRSMTFDIFNKIYRYQLSRVLRFMTHASPAFISWTPELTLGHLCQATGIEVYNSLASIHLIRYVDKHGEEKDQGWDNLIAINPRV